MGAWQCSLAQEAKGFVADKIIAKVDNYIVLRSELEGAYQNYLANGGTASEASKCGLFSQLVITKLLVAKAEIDSVLVTDLEVDNNTEQRMNMILQNSGNSPEQLERTYGKTLEQSNLRESYHLNVIAIQRGKHAISLESKTLLKGNDILLMIARPEDSLPSGRRAGFR